jgi:hypothetical protein
VPFTRASDGGALGIDRRVDPERRPARAVPSGGPGQGVGERASQAAKTPTITAAKQTTRQRPTDVDDPRDEFAEPEPLDEHELALIEQDLADLTEFRAAFEPEGIHGVAVWCDDCSEEHYYGWDILEANLTSLLETGETPVHEPAYQPEPSHYVAWDYARGYVDALREVGVGNRRSSDRCGRCNLGLDGATAQANFCPRCGTPLLPQRLAAALSGRLAAGEVVAVLREIGLPARE